MRISNSFSEGEIQVMEFILQTLLRGGTPNMAVRHKEFPSLCRKVMSMRQRLNALPTERRSAEKSGVGEIEAPIDAAELDRKAG